MFYGLAYDIATRAVVARSWRPLKDLGTPVQRSVVEATTTTLCSSFARPCRRAHPAATQLNRPGSPLRNLLFSCRVITRRRRSCARPSGTALTDFSLGSATPPANPRQPHGRVDARIRVATAGGARTRVRPRQLAAKRTDRFPQCRSPCYAVM
jgi:hypothetical protein